MDQLPDYLTDASITQAVDIALAEDIGTGDKTVKLLSSDKNAQARIFSRVPGILCGAPWVNKCFEIVDSSVTLQWHKSDGEVVFPDDTIVEIKGPAAAILTAERTALNFLQLLSGTATLTHQYCQKLKTYPCDIVDTRKTVPGLRVAQKYAVLCGGGKNHRIGLYDGILIKENHLKLSNIKDILTAARRSDLFIEIEVESLTELENALDYPCDVIMLDNFSVGKMVDAVSLTAGRRLLEASGNITLSNLEAVAQTGVNRIAIGAITKVITPLDLSLIVD